MSVIGEFIDADKPIVLATVAWNDAIQKSPFILDTGFTGDLVVTRKIAAELGITADAVMPVNLAGNRNTPTPYGVAIAVMEGKNFLVTVFVIEEGWPLLGISFMEKFGYCAEVDCKNKTVRLVTV
jgi:predicted aspartyl protease